MDLEEEEANEQNVIGDYQNYLEQPQYLDEINQKRNDTLKDNASNNDIFEKINEIGNFHYQTELNKEDLKTKEHKKIKHKNSISRGMARGLGIAQRVTSPTFTIVNEYIGKRSLFHFDMYRLGGADELFDIGWEDYLARGAVCAVEWSENVEDAFEGDEVTVRIERLGENERRIEIEGMEGHADSGH